jgi:valyl-tRNA synthetase
VNDPSVPRGEETDGNYWVTAHTHDEALEKAAKKFNVPKEKITLKWGKSIEV